MIQGDLFGPPAAPAGNAGAGSPERPGDGSKPARLRPARANDAEEATEQAPSRDQRAIGKEVVKRQAIDDQQTGAAQADDQPASEPQPGAIGSPTDLGRLVRAARKRKGIAQQVFADAAGVGRRFLSELENGKPTLELGKVLTVASAAGIVIFAGER